MRKTLTTVNWIAEADTLAAQLEMNGITAYVPDQGMVTANPVYANAIGGIRVQVDEADLEAAREILAGNIPSSEEGLFECPLCGSDKVQYQQYSKRFAVLTIMLLGLPLLWRKQPYTCNNCMHVWDKE
ncbi:hypothetical protein BVX97_03625 [bacterium E08(2017)]|nr:hypothetical protein BVX97_03625 [bacterium E08(2017)]